MWTEIEKEIRRKLFKSCKLLVKKYFFSAKIQIKRVNHLHLWRATFVFILCWSKKSQFHYFSRLGNFMFKTYFSQESFHFFDEIFFKFRHLRLAKRLTDKISTYSEFSQPFLGHFNQNILTFWWKILILLI